MHTLAANLLLGLLIDLAYVGLLKGAIRRPRPVYNNASDFLLVVKVDQYSFPSGHAARVMFLAIFAFMWLHERHAGLAVGICIWAGVTALSRCLMGRHYLGDVLAGALTGVATAATLSKGTFVAGQSWISGEQAQLWHHAALRQWQDLRG
ncbi:g12022 [Coccomyxa viridis]|uniref:G12022 protein n=1 Tax=Coccomyxa viridis TaxID=1274662 RepID=A0ABP1GDG7_9CHLO